jgi:hypothetical protein
VAVRRLLVELCDVQSAHVRIEEPIKEFIKLKQKKWLDVTYYLCFSYYLQLAFYTEWYSARSNNYLEEL